ncbi:MAG TPA: hypothetical protein PL063_09070 [Candidatus Cloacimonadota bacterium]|nr:hypothetical protein [Candidatus Cloacimonadota bacterium]HOQ80791.1 hypothetical protein [Candidatus Cloacimonadota bacterium]HPK40713.1 hypothetical protein [Candidatus Cloacimonadota bacterium]HPY97351.1 hypothetical protein [Candidatus Cloacimonadota bacterium]
MKNIINTQTQKALQLNEILAKIKPFSELGSRLHKNFKSFKKDEQNRLIEYYQKIATLIKAIGNYPDFISALGSYLHYFQWIKKSIEDSAMCSNGDSNVLEIHEIFEIKHFIYYYQKVANYLKAKNQITLIPLYDFADLFSFLDREKQNTPSFYLNPSYTTELEMVHEKINALKQQIEAEFSVLKRKLTHELSLAEFNEKLTVSRLKTDLLERLQNCSLLKIDYENFANVTFVLKKTDKILSAEAEIAKLNDSLFAEERKARQLISLKIGEQSKELIGAFHNMAELDLMLAKAIFAINNKCCIPAIEQSPKIHCAQLTNLALKDELIELGLTYQPVDVAFQERVIVLTGANMAGKTSILKAIGQAFSLLVLGIPIPASTAQLFIPDYIHFSGPLTHEHRADLSSFALEVVNLQQLVENRHYGLILMDEFARGTNPEEGTALSQAVIQYFTAHDQANFITATHFNPPELDKNSQHFRLLGIADADYEKLREHDITWLKSNLGEMHKYFDYQMQEVEMNKEAPKAAFMIAELLGLNREILSQAKAYLKDEK